MSDYGVVTPMVADSYLSGFNAPTSDINALLAASVPGVKQPTEPFFSSLIVPMINLAILFIFFLAFLSISGTSAHYSSAPTVDRARFAVFLSLFSISLYNLVLLIYRFVTKSGNPNTNLIWVFSIMLIFTILSVTYFGWLST